MRSRKKVHSMEIIMGQQALRVLCCSTKDLPYRHCSAIDNLSHPPTLLPKQSI
jgi:hypothetical protein